MPHDLVTRSLAAHRLAPATATLALTRYDDPGGGFDPPRWMAPVHVHHHDDEAWYVVEGELALQLGDDEVRTPAGGAALAPHGVAHTFWNPRAEPASYVIVLTQSIQALIDAIHASPTRERDAIEAIFEAHDSAVVRWP
jgi:mannose-6-phosphate isomerase-like protein (cupin superfamily)